jgi:hypothetical protein
MPNLSRGQRVPLAITISLLLLFIGGSGIGYAATNRTLLLGRGNTNSKATGLRSKHGPTLALTNTGGKSAASFDVQKGQSPFTVNSSVEVKSLNADLLDGFDSSAFQRRVTGSCAAGSAIHTINIDGSLACVNVVSQSWKLTGNTGTTPGADFLGTTDAQPLIFKTNNTEALRIDATGNLGVGTTDPGARIDAQTNVTSGIAINGASSSGTAINGVSNTSDGVIGTSTSARGVAGVSTSSTGVQGTSNTADGVTGYSTSGTGVYGQSTDATGVNGQAISGIAVNGDSSSGTAINGVSNTADGVIGTSTSARGVAGVSTSSTGVQGTSNTADGVTGQSTSGGAGVLGEGPNDGVMAITSHAFGGGTAAAVLADNTSNGDIFIGESGGVKVARIDGSGAGYFDSGTQVGGADYAESMRAVNDKTLVPGDVLAIDPRHGNQVRLSDHPDSQMVIGVYSTKPSVLAVGNHHIGDSLAGNVPVAMLGIVPTKVSAANGPIKPGDLLTTAKTPGYAMKAKPVVIRGIAIYPTGAILGKALQPLKAGRGLINVLVEPR